MMASPHLSALAVYDGPLNARPASGDLPFSLFGYTPKRGFNIFAAVMWGLLLVAHVWWLVKKRTRVAQGLIVFGSIWQLIGYAIRAHSHTNPFRSNLFIAQYTILHVSPVIFIMALVSAIGWGMRGTAGGVGRYETYRPKMVTSVIQALNVIVLILITIGSTMYTVALARVADARSVGYNAPATRKVLIAGYALEILSLLLILALLTRLFRQYSHDSVRTTRHGPTSTTTTITGNTTTDSAAVHPTSSADHAGSGVGLLTKLFLAVSFLSAGILLMRACYRLAETVQDLFGRTWNSEALFGVFEFAPVFVVVAIWAARPFATQLADAGYVHGSGTIGTHGNKATV